MMKFWSRALPRAALLLQAPILICACEGAIGDSAGTTSTTSANAADPIAYPCGSPKKDSQYYDFRSGVCVTPQSQAERYVLYVHAHLHNLALHADSPITFTIKLTNVTPLNFAEAATGLNVLSFDRVSFYFPTLASGTHATAQISSASSATDLMHTAEVYLKAQYVDFADSPIQEDAASLLTEAFVADTTQVVALVVQAKSSDILSWWDKNYTTIDVAFPVKSPLPWPHQQEEFFQ